MRQKKLYRTIETAASKKFSSEKELLEEIVKQLVNDNQFNITGGRIWKLNSQKKAYMLLFQTGKTEKLEKDFILKFDENEILKKIAKERTILADETNRDLIEKGIIKYSASGVGPISYIDGEKYYKYLIALNSDNIDDDLFYTLNIVATVLTSKLREDYLSATRSHLQADLGKAQELQKSILPEHELDYHGFTMFGITVPAEILGGDFFDYLSISDEERLGIAVGDAASKGVAAAAEAMYISGAIRMASTFQIKISTMMKRLNQLVNKIFSDDRFISLFYGEVSNDSKGLFLYANAGHNPPMLLKRETDEVICLTATGPLLGPTPHSGYKTDSVNFDYGDILVIYSDGITEAANDEFEFYEEERLKNIIIKNKNETPKTIALNILEDVQNFSTLESKYQDDKTIVVIQRKFKDE